MLFETFLLQLAKVLQFPTLAPDANGACLIIMKKDNLPLLFELDEQIVPNKILISTQITSFPIDRRVDIYEESLKLNDLIEETVSVKPDEDLLYLHRRITPEIDAKELDEIVQSFIKTIQSVKSHIEETLKNPSNKTPPSSFQAFPYKA